MSRKFKGISLNKRPFLFQVGYEGPVKSGLYPAGRKSIVHTTL